MHIPENLAQAIDNYLKGKASAEEKQLVNEWYYSFNDDEVEIPSAFKDLHAMIEARLMTRLRQSTRIKTPVSTTFFHKKSTWISAAASLLLIITAGFYFKHQLFPNKVIAPVQVVASDIKPGGNKAVLILGNGKTISLTNAKVGDIASQSGSRVSKTKDGLLVYSATGKPASPSAIDYNTIETPNGGQYQVNLPDGTKVWLNAASSLKYPVRFAANQRTVELNGEGYFEVAKDKLRPFKVITNKQSIEVLGTHFNVNSYADEQYVKTTLLEGSVKITLQNLYKNSQKDLILKPGEQSSIGDRVAEIKQVDVDNAIAWKNGNFIFDGENLQSIMRKISKWYDVKIAYQNIPQNTSFTGVVSRSKNLTTVIQALESTGKVHFKVAGKQIIVL